MNILYPGCQGVNVIVAFLSSELGIMLIFILFVTFSTAFVSVQL